MNVARLRLLVSFPKQSINLIGSVRSGVWPANYQEPVISTQDLAMIKQTDPTKFKELTYNPIKPLHHFKNNSLFHDHFFFRFEAEMVMKGNRNLARELVNETLFHIKRIQLKKWNAATTGEKQNQIELDPVKIFKQAFENCQPVLTVKSIKRGGAKYQVPSPVTAEQSFVQTIKWLRDTIRDRPKPRKIHFPEALAKELVSAYHNEGKVIKLKNDLHKLCEANKAYVHYRWA